MTPTIRAPAFARAALCLAALFAAACGSSVMQPTGPMDQRTRDALPAASTVAVSPPGGASDAGTVNPDSAAGGSSVLLADTVALGFSVNGGVAWTLGLLQAVVALPATSCDASSCTWGPTAINTDPVSWQLAVSFGSDGYDYILSGMARTGGDGQFHTVVSGTAVPSGSPHRGSGNFTVDLDQANALNPKNFTQGKLQVSYSNVMAGWAMVDATFLGTPDTTHAGESDNAIYQYVEDGQGGGSLQAAARNLTSNDVLAIDSRWVASGAGRADVSLSINDGLGSSFSATESECWAGAASANPAPFHVVYFSSSDAANLGPDSGDAGSCAFPSAQPTALSAP